MIEDSFIKMSKDEVIKRCEKTIARIKRNRQAEDDNEHRRIMNSRNKSWLRKLFGRPQVTLEDVAKECKECEGYTDWPFRTDWTFYPSCRGWGTLDAAKRILRAAKASKDDVYLSSSDLYHIW